MKTVAILGSGPVCDTAREVFPTGEHFSSLVKLEESGKTFDLGVSAWNNEILRPRHLALARDGWINTHPSLLPYGRGRDPYFWAIVNDEPFGATIHWIDEGVDTGEIITQMPITVTPQDTSISLRDKAIRTLQKMLKLVSLWYYQDDILPGVPQRSGPYPTRRRQEMLDYRIRMDAAINKYLRANTTGYVDRMVKGQG